MIFEYNKAADARIDFMYFIRVLVAISSFVVQYIR